VGCEWRSYRGGGCGWGCYCFCWDDELYERERESCMQGLVDWRLPEKHETNFTVSKIDFSTSREKERKKESENRSIGRYTFKKTCHLNLNSLSLQPTNKPSIQSSNPLVHLHGPPISFLPIIKKFPTLPLKASHSPPTPHNPPSPSNNSSSHQCSG
jgi:hypothetical protein